MFEVDPQKAANWDRRWDRFANLSDMNTAIIGGKILDDALRKLLGDPIDKFKPYSDRIKRAKDSGLISQEMQADLAIIGHIRNAFAHETEDGQFEGDSFDDSFEDKTVADMCYSLKYGTGSLPPGSPAKDYFRASVALLKYAMSLPSSSLGPIRNHD